MVSELSGGQQRRISLAATLVSNSSMVILDEPTVGIDLLIIQKIWTYLNDRCHNGLTILFVTHYIEEATNAHKVGLMRNGRLLAEDKPDSLVNNFNEPSLESVFLKLCLLSDSTSAKISNDKKSLDHNFCEDDKWIIKNEESKYRTDNSTERISFIKSLFFKLWIVFVLMRRNLLKYFHMNSAIICILLPATQVLSPF